MSYCRWSSDNWKCDLYCYADVMGGYTTHVASNRREPIGLEHDGETFNDPDLESFLKRLLYLREAGYCFPDEVLDEVKQEIEAEKKGG